MTHDDTEGPNRRCILTRTSGPAEHLIRLALGPDGQVAADLGARLAGRGAWISIDRALVEKAMARGQLQGTLVRALKHQPITLSETLPDDIARGLQARALDRLGLEMRAGHLLWGHERISDALGRGRVRLLLHADDAGEDGTGKLEMKRRAACPTSTSLVLPIGRTILSVALGRQNVVHAALVDEGSAARVTLALQRWAAFEGRFALEGMTPGMTIETEDKLQAAVAVGSN